MTWYEWRIWRVAWSRNRGDVIEDGSGRWVRVFHNLWWRESRDTYMHIPELDTENADRLIEAFRREGKSPDTDPDY